MWFRLKLFYLEAATITHLSRFLRSSEFMKACKFCLLYKRNCQFEPKSRGRLSNQVRKFKTHDWLLFILSNGQCFFGFILFLRLRSIRRTVFHGKVDLWKDVLYFSLHRQKYMFYYHENNYPDTFCCLLQN